MFISYGDDLAPPNVQAGGFLLAQYDKPHVPSHCGQAFPGFRRDDDELVGCFMGLGKQSQRIVNGVIELRSEGSS